MKFTLEQKMQAISDHLYNRDDRPYWEPYVDAYYTIIRNDLELFRIVAIDTFRKVVGIQRADDQYLADCEEHGFENAITEFDIDGFTTDGFGPQRIPVPAYILGIEKSPNKPKEPWE